MAATDVPKLQLAGAPLLAKSPQIGEIVEWRLRAGPFFGTLGITDVTIGNPPGTLPGNVLAVNVTLGKRYRPALVLGKLVVAPKQESTVWGVPSGVQFRCGTI